MRETWGMLSEHVARWSCQPWSGTANRMNVEHGRLKCLGPKRIGCRDAGAKRPEVVQPKPKGWKGWPRGEEAAARTA
jgi:hypothetical protein